MVFLAGIVLAVALLVPAAWFPLQLGKLGVFVLALLVASVLFVVGRGTQELSRAHGVGLALLVGVLPLSYLFSTLAAGTGAVSITGFGIEVDTVVFTALAFATFLLSFSFFKTLRTVRMLSSVVFFTLVGVVAFQWLVVLFGNGLIPFSVFADRSVNLVGKWNDLGILTGLLAVFLLVQAELTRPSVIRRAVLAVALIAITVLLGIINFALVWWFVFASALVIALVAFMTQRTEERVERQANPYASVAWSQKVPWFAASAAIVSIIFLLYGAGLNQSLTNRFQVSSLEVRPSYASTFGVISAAREGSVASSLIGTGPNTFSASWVAHKPAEVNQSAFWNLDFNVGFSTLVTALGTAGLVGAIAWMIPLLLVLAGVIRAVRYSLLSREERMATLTVGLGAVLLLSAIIFYVPSANVVLLGFALAGAAFGFLWRQGRHASEEESPMPLMGMAGWAVALILVLVSVWGTWSVERRFVAQAINNTGAVSLQAGNADDAISAAHKSQGIEYTSDNLRLAIEAGIVKIGQLANSTQAATPALQQQFLDVASTTIASANQLAMMYPKDHRSYYTMGRVYDLLASLKVQGAYKNAELAYQKALEINPSAPDIALALARVEATEGNLELTQKYLSQSLTLKPNYTDAILLVVQLNVANNDIPSAIRAAQAAAQTAPGVAPIWFQLGLLYYAGGDTANAVPALEQAIKLVPDYANAKYFLGLSYYAQKNTAGAIKEFEDLARSNPESAEAKLILSNLRAGKQPFESAQPPITNNPATRSSAPINE